MIDPALTGTIAYLLMLSLPPPCAYFFSFFTSSGWLGYTLKLRSNHHRDTTIYTEANGEKSFYLMGSNLSRL